MLYECISENEINLYHGQIAVAMDVEIPNDKTEIKGRLNRYVLLGDLVCDATTGRFINEDPIQDGTNWFVYCNNNPLVYINSMGLALVLSRPNNYELKETYE